METGGEQWPQSQAELPAALGPTCGLARVIEPLSLSCFIYKMGLITLLFQVCCESKKKNDGSKEPAHSRCSVIE